MGYYYLNLDHLPFYAIIINPKFPSSQNDKKLIQ